MKKFLEIQYIVFGLLKVASVCIAALYSVFWFYRFFNLPFVDYLVPIFDFPINLVPLPIATLQIHGDHVVENAYFGMGIILAFVAFIFSRLEVMAARIQEKYDALTFAKKQQAEIKMNEELEREYVANLLRYKYFSILIKYRIKYINEIIAQNNSLTIVDVAADSYTETASYIRRMLPHLGVKQNKASLFIRVVGFKDFDEIMGDVLNAIKLVRAKNEKNAMSTEFSILLDAQKTEEECSESYKSLTKIAESGYYEKAVVTAFFKARFDLIKNDSKFMIDTLGFSVSDRSKTEDGTELFVLKTKPKLT